MWHYIIILRVLTIIYREDKNNDGKIARMLKFHYDSGVAVVTCKNFLYSLLFTQLLMEANATSDQLIINAYINNAVFIWDLTYAFFYIRESKFNIT